MDIDKRVDSLLEEDSYYQARATELVSSEMLKERHREELKEALKNQDLSQAIIRGFRWIKEDIIEVLTVEELEPFFNDLSKINEEHLKNPPPAVCKKLSDSQTVCMQELFELSDHTMQKIYTLGYQYFQKKEIDRAIDIFSVVTAFNPCISDFWNALALCYQAKNELQLAIEAFTYACKTNEISVAPLVSRAECCLKLNLIDEAHREIEFASKIVETNPALDEEWGEYIKELKRSV